MTSTRKSPGLQFVAFSVTTQGVIPGVINAEYFCMVAIIVKVCTLNA